uniref:Peptidase S1 domain-containing protein n=1 Tax=Prolemur simus TaxID=1328070 RepID=A0A8C8YMK6_PROSS
MTCGSGDLLTSPVPSARIANQPYVEGPWFLACGHTNISCRMVKGKMVEVGKWPWQVSILFLGMHICSGSLIHRQWVLTAAHCLERSKDPAKYSVMVGVQHLPENGTQLLLTSIVIHEDFNNHISGDIALLKLRDAILWSPLVQPICLPNTRLKPYIGNMCWVIGWGRTEKIVTPGSPYSLQEVAVKIINNEICYRRYQFLFSKDEKFTGNDVLCGNSEWGSDTCQANSGSSLVCQVNKTWIQMGVVSWSFSCGRRQFPGIYTSTSYFTNWIRTQVADMRFLSRADPAFLSPVFLTGYILLVSLGSLWLL